MKYLGQTAVTKLLQLVKTKFDSLSITRGQVNITQTQSTITIPITYSDSSKLLVYHNGILLNYTEHYTINSNKQVILANYNAESGDVISFVYHNI